MVNWERVKKDLAVVLDLSKINPYKAGKFLATLGHHFSYYNASDEWKRVCEFVFDEMASRLKLKDFTSFLRGFDDYLYQKEGKLLLSETHRKGLVAKMKYTGVGVPKKLPVKLPSKEALEEAKEMVKKLKGE